MSKKVARARRIRVPRSGERLRGLSRATLYNLAGQYAGLFVKFGNITLIDLDMLDRIIEANVRPATIKAPPARVEIGEMI